MESRRSGLRQLAVAAVCVLVASGAGLGFGYLGYTMAAGRASDNGRTGSAELPSTSVILQNTDAPAGQAGGVADVVEAVADSVVEVYVTRAVSGGTERAAGSGVVITDTGYIATNHHVVEDAQQVTVRLRSGGEYEAVVVAADEKTDLGLIKISAENLSPAVFGDSDSLRVGQTVVAIGNPLGSLGGSVTDGILSALERQITINGITMNLMQTNAEISPGNSGGGLFDASGNLIGIVNAKSGGENVEGIGFAIPANLAKDVLTQLMEQGYVSGRVDPGIEVTANTSIFTGYRIGLYVTAVTSENGSAFAVMDYIASINGTAMTTLSEYNSFMDGCKVGDTIVYSVIRGSRQITVSQTLTEKVPAPVSD